MKVFGLLRQKLLSENKFKSYTLYAIGEILLVVVGILIALQIDNQSEYKKERKQEAALLTNLKNDIALDVKQIDANTEETILRLGKLDSLVQLLQTPDNVDKKSFVQESFEFVFDNYFRSNSGVFDEAVSSGRMSYIENETLRQNIFDYYRNAKVNENDETSRQLTDELITPIFVETLYLNPQGFSSLGLNIEKVSTLKSLDIVALKSNKEFWKMLLLKFGSNREQVLRWQEIKKKAQEVEEEIQLQLKKLDD
ncbi:DUF6090 family protein [uncultured Croceitalea sp.]|uniref:DUF6090 family protein n=1 Tax=uncultured Croceitalea sp. TaxID=1798908 RepID=UPI003305798B